MTIRNLINDFIGRRFDRKYRVALLCNWCEDLGQEWKNMLPNNSKIELVSRTENPDVYVVINRYSPQQLNVPRKRVIYFLMEPKQGLDSRGAMLMWANSNGFLAKFDRSSDHNAIEWHISMNYDDLFSPVTTPKIDRVSAILSAKFMNPGHQNRIMLVKKLEKAGVNIDVFGTNKYDYANFQSIHLPYRQKEKGLLPYKYTIGIENFSEKNYVTEKLIDGILCECLVFYWGCYNVREYIPEDAYIYLDLYDINRAIRQIQKAIEENAWKKRLPIIRQAKKHILNNLSFFRRLEKVLDERVYELEKVTRSECVPGIGSQSLLAIDKGSSLK